MNAPFPYPPEGAAAGVVNGLSVDVEDWFQVGAFENVIARGEWDSIKTRVEDNVYRVIDLFAEADVSATFFTLGWVAQRHPNMIRRIVDAGHEVASHGYDHARVFTFSRAEFAEDIRKAREVIEDCSGVRVTEIAPGRVQTQLYRTAMGMQAAGSELYDGYASIMPEDIAQLLLDLDELPGLFSRLKLLSSTKPLESDWLEARAIWEVPAATARAITLHFIICIEVAPLVLEDLLSPRYLYMDRSFFLCRR